MRANRCVLLFSRPPDEEARAKGLRPAGPLFHLLRARLSADVATIACVDLVLVGRAGTKVPPGVTRLVEQRGATFGERLENAFEDLRALGYKTSTSELPHISLICRTISLII